MTVGKDNGRPQFRTENTIKVREIIIIIIIIIIISY
jgi:hypothetical protein